MTTIRSAVAAAALILSALSAVGQPSRQPDVADPTLDPAKLAAASNNWFGAEMFVRLLASRGAAENLVFSPHSLAAALSLAAPGAGGETAAAFVGVLKTAKIAPADMLARQGALQKSLNGASDVTLRIANGLWAAADTPLKGDYVAKVKLALAAELAPLPANAAEAAKRINDWVNAQTKGAIAKLFERLPENTRAVLVNALHFKADWATGFEAAQTKPMPFHRAAGGDVSVAMMQRFDDGFRYRETAAYQAVLVPYRGERFQLVVVLPKPKVHAAELIQPLNLKELTGALGYRRAPGRLGLPKLDLTDNLQLNAPLRAGGLDIAFTDRADFSGLAARPLLISQVLQRTKLEIDEKGTTAAAATGITMAPTSAREPVPPFTMICDRPYLLLLQDSQSGAVLFMAYIGDPQAAGR